MDFIVELPLSHGCMNIMVIMDRLSKGVIIEPCKEMNAESMADIFLQVVR